MDEKKSALLPDNRYEASSKDEHTLAINETHSTLLDTPTETTLPKVQRIQRQEQKREVLSAPTAMTGLSTDTHTSNEAGQTQTGSSAHKSKKFIDTQIRSFKQRSRRSQILIIALVMGAITLLGAVAYTGWFMLYPTPPITAFVVGQQQQVPRDVSGFGPVASQQQSNVAFAAPGHVASILVKPGDTVKQGTPLLKLDPSQLQAQIDLAANNVNARRSYLDAVSNAAPYNPVTVAAAQQNYEVAQNQYRALMAQTNFHSLHNSDLISQIDGVVMQISVNPGDNFTANQILMVVANQASVIVNAKLPLDARPYVHVDDPVQVSALGLRNINIPGKILAVVPQVDPQTDSFTVQVLIANPQATLWSGMNAYVQIHSMAQAFSVPRISVLNPDQESAVYVIQNGRVHIRQVHVIGSSPDGNSMYIDSGLSAGEQIVVLPLNRMHENLPITIGTTER